MKNYLFPFVFLFSAAAVAEPVSLRVDDYKHITFSGKNPNKHSNADDALSIEVDKSASALIMPFAKARTVREVDFWWRATGRTNVTDKAAEQSRKGDDFVLRIGLILAGDPPFIPFFAPAWVKAIRDQMLLPADRLYYIVTDTRTPEGDKWSSAFSSSIQYVAATSALADKDGWRFVQQSFNNLDVVGLWLMADGDDTKATFTTSLKNLELK